MNDEKEGEKMAFGIGINSQYANAGAVRGKQREIACECWFTSTGKVTPLMLKLQDEEGVCHVVKPILVHSQEKKLYAGTPSIEFDCSIWLKDQQQRVYLIFYINENRWVLNMR